MILTLQEKATADGTTPDVILKKLKVENSYKYYTSSRRANHNIRYRFIEGDILSGTYFYNLCGSTLLSAFAVSALLRLPASAIRWMRDRRDGPKYQHIIGKKDVLVYYLKDVVAYVNRQLKRTMENKKR